MHGTLYRLQTKEPQNPQSPYPLPGKKWELNNGGTGEGRGRREGERKGRSCASIEVFNVNDVYRCPFIQRTLILLVVCRRLEDTPTEITMTGKESQESDSWSTVSVLFEGDSNSRHGAYYYAVSVNVQFLPVMLLKACSVFMLHCVFVHLLLGEFRIPLKSSLSIQSICHTIRGGSRRHGRRGGGARVGWEWGLRRRRRREGWKMGTGFPFPSRLGGPGKSRELPQRSPGRKQISLFSWRHRIPLV